MPFQADSINNLTEWLNLSYKIAILVFNKEELKLR